jgi:carbon-monoxide dehydrogenase large subunit
MEQTFKNASPGSLLGESVARLDAARFVSGRVDFSADLIPEGTLHLAILRSAHACATIVSIDLSDALAMPGVIAGLTGEDAARMSDAMPPAMDLPATGARGPLQSRCLALGHATYFGQPVAALVANSVHDAQAALAKIDFTKIRTATRRRIDHHRAGAAIAGQTADPCAFRIERIADQLDEQQPRVHSFRTQLSIELEPHLDRSFHVFVPVSRMRKCRFATPGTIARR